MRRRRLAIGGPQLLLRWSEMSSMWNTFASFSSAGAGAAQEGFSTIKEGQVEILMDSANSVFYNKAQVHNRDLSIAFLRTFMAKRCEEHDARMRKTADEGGSTESAQQDRHLRQCVNQNRLHRTNSNIDTELVDMKNFKAPRVLEALAASGLRAIRYAREVDGIGKVVALDNCKVAVASCKRNIELNGSGVSSKMVVHNADSRVYMLSHPKEFDAVDIDPYGSPAEFLDSAVQTVVDGGVLMCSATDMAVLAGGSGEACFPKYGSYPVKGKYCHEMALRILLACIESHANRHKRYIVPILSVHMDFYIRVFLRVFTSPSKARSSPLKLSYVYQCVGCDSFHLQSLGRTIHKGNQMNQGPPYGPAVPHECSDCGAKFVMGGPIWSAPIHDQEWVTSILSNVTSARNAYPSYEKIVSVLNAVVEELPDAPLFLNIHSLCATLKCTPLTTSMFHSALINAGYLVSGSHTDPIALKTDAPMGVIWDIMRCWVKIHAVKPQSCNERGTRILSKEPLLQAHFAKVTASTKRKRTARFLPNPERNWGPKSKARKQVPVI